MIARYKKNSRFTAPEHNCPKMSEKPTISVNVWYFGIEYFRTGHLCSLILPGRGLYLAITEQGLGAVSENGDLSHYVYMWLALRLASLDSA